MEKPVKRKNARILENNSGFSSLNSLNSINKSPINDLLKMKMPEMDSTAKMLKHNSGFSSLNSLGSINKSPINDLLKMKMPEMDSTAKMLENSLLNQNQKKNHLMIDHSLNINENKHNLYNNKKNRDIKKIENEKELQIKTVSKVNYDVFISHASEDKESFVRPLVEELESKGYKVWYDEFTLKVGDSLRRSIDEGLKNSRYGIVVLSNSFIKKNWGQYELNGLLNKEMQGKKVILPIWHKVTKEEVQDYSLAMADKKALNSTELSVDEIVNLLIEELKDK